MHRALIKKSPDFWEEKPNWDKIIGAPYLLISLAIEKALPIKINILPKIIDRKQEINC